MEKKHVRNDISFTLSETSPIINKYDVTMSTHFVCNTTNRFIFTLESCDNSNIHKHGKDIDKNNI